MVQRLYIFTYFFILLSLSSSAADYTYDFSSGCHLAYRQIMALQEEEANNTLEEEIKRNPNNLIPYYLADYNDCLALLFNGDRASFTNAKERLESRLSRLEDGPVASPWYRFCLANVYLHWALVQLRFGDQLKAAQKFRKSFLLLKDNKTKFPNFSENKVLGGLELAVAGAIPENYKWLASIMGIRGNINQGVAELAQYLNQKESKLMQEEAIIYYAYLRFYLQSNPESAWKYLDGPQYKVEGNLMRSFIKANLALNFRKAEVAQKILKEALQLPQVNLYPIFYYEMGEALLAHLDFDCIPFYEFFLNHYKGNHFVKDAHLKIAQSYYLRAEKNNAQKHLLYIINQGSSLTDADKQALSFAEKPDWPSPQLLQIRLLIDGGLYSKALHIIQSIDKKTLNDNTSVLEYNFRYGRIFEELGNAEKAVLFYDATIAIGRNRKEYFAARACLQKALIYERLGKKQEAISLFKDCLSMRNHDAQNSIDQLAKAGLNRLGNLRP